MEKVETKQEKQVSAALAKVDYTVAQQDAINTVI